MMMTKERFEDIIVGIPIGMFLLLFIQYYGIDKMLLDYYYEIKSYELIQMLHKEEKKVKEFKIDYDEIKWDMDVA
jgi:hypothetical protein